LDNTDIVLTTYETLLSDHNQGADPVFSQHWRRIVLDEGMHLHIRLPSVATYITGFAAHRIANRSTGTFKAATRLQAKFRWALTGTPIRNSLLDFSSLLAFIRVPDLCEKSRFSFWISSHSSPQRKLALDTLRTLIRATCIRRTKAACKDALMLPKLTEEVVQIELSTEDRELYNFFADNAASIVSGRGQGSPFGERQSGRVLGRGREILTLINFLRRICDHGLEMLPPRAIECWHERKNLNWDVIKQLDDTGDESDDGTASPDDSTQLSSRKRLDSEDNNERSENGDGDSNHVAHSAKLRAVIENLLNEQRLLHDPRPGGKRFYPRSF
jgi:SNF2 family DNA or RNA helicase